jgi:alpha-tubulin suppressor-like RCC1 family protein
VAVSCGAGHKIALGADGKVYGSGNTKVGQLGLGGSSAPVIFQKELAIARFTSDKIIKVATRTDASFVLTENGTIYSFGNNNHGQLGLGYMSSNVLNPTPIRASLGRIIDLKIGYHHGYVMNSDLQVFGFGQNGNGEIGTSDVSSKPIPTLFPHFSGSTLKDFFPGYKHTFVRVQDGSIFCFGINFVSFYSSSLFSMGDLVWGTGKIDLKLIWSGKMISFRWVPDINIRLFLTFMDMSIRLD